RPPARLSELEPDVPAALDRLVGRMLEKNPAARPQSMNEVVAALESFLACDRSAFGRTLVEPDAPAPTTPGPIPAPNPAPDTDVDSAAQAATLLAQTP